MKSNTNINSKPKTTARIVLISSAITAVTLALVTAVTVSMMPIVHTANAVSCPSHCACSPNGQNFACSGGGFGSCGSVISCSISIGHGITEAGPGGSSSASISSKGTHHPSSNGGATGGEGNCADTTCSGNK